MARVKVFEDKKYFNQLIEFPRTPVLSYRWLHCRKIGLSQSLDGSDEKILLLTSWELIVLLHVNDAKICAHLSVNGIIFFGNLRVECQNFGSWKFGIERNGMLLDDAKEETDTSKISRSETQNSLKSDFYLYFYNSFIKDNNF